MRFKILEYPRVVIEKEFLIFPRRFKGYKYWLCWVVVEYHYLEHLGRYQRFGIIIDIVK
jgi:hypothetical protein